MFPELTTYSLLLSTFKMSEGRTVVIAMDGSQYANDAFTCKFYVF